MISGGIQMDNNAVQLFQMKVAHIGINAADAGEGSQWADQFLELMGLERRETKASYFSGEMVEIMKQNGRGTKGHIGFSVNNCEKAMEYFAKRGVAYLEETKKFDDQGNCIFVYFQQEIGGFAIHLIQQAQD